MSDVGIVSSASTANVAGTTLDDLAYALAQRLGGARRFSTTSTASATNLLVSSDMIDDEAPTSKYGGWYVYVRGGSPSNGGSQQRVRRAGYTGSTGTFTTVAGFGVAMPAGCLIELHGTMPRIEADGLMGIRECINRMARKFWVRDVYVLTGVASQILYPLGALYWATEGSFVRLLDAPLTASDDRAPSHGRFDIRFDGETVNLVLDSPYATGDSFGLEVIRPTNSRIKQSGAWADQSSPLAGLTDDSDALLGNFNDLFQCALYECMLALSVQAGGARKAYWRAEAARQLMVVNQIKMYHLDDGDMSLGEGPNDAAAASWASSDGTKGLWSSF